MIPFVPPPGLVVQRSDDVDDGEAYEAVLGGRVVGTVVFARPGASDGAPWCRRADVSVLARIEVDEACRRRGIGRTLLEYAERRVRQLGAAEFALTVSESAHQLVALFTRRGYRTVERADAGHVVLSKAVGASTPSLR